MFDNDDFDEYPDWHDELSPIVVLKYQIVTCRIALEDDDLLRPRTYLNSEGMTISRQEYRNFFQMALSRYVQQLALFEKNAGMVDVNEFQRQKH